jgi:hypothetical protein
LVVSALSLLLIVAAGILSDVTEWRWGQIFTAKNVFLVGCLVFLVGGLGSAIFVSPPYLTFPQEAVERAAVFFVLGQASFLLGYALKSSGHGSGFMRMLTGSPSKARIWFWIACFVGIGAFGYEQIRSGTDFGGGVETNLWDHLVSLLVPAGALLGFVIVRKTSSLLERLAAAALEASILSVYLTVWSRRPGQTILLASLAYYSVSKQLTRKTQVKLGLVAVSIALLLATGQDIYRGMARNEQFDTRYLGDYLKDYWKIVSDQGLVDTFQAASAVAYTYPEKHSYLYGESFWALVANPIPRRFWPDKPVGFGMTIAQEIFGTEMPPTNFGPSIQGELYANGGLLAVILGVGLVGYLCKTFDWLLLGRFRSESSLLLHATSLYQFFFLARGDFLDVGYAFMSTVPPLFIALAVGGRGSVLGGLPGER